jgi:GrpB protein
MRRKRPIGCGKIASVPQHELAYKSTLYERRLGQGEGRTMADQSIELTAYDPTWPVRFAEQQTRLAALLRPWLAGEIEHVGSTSVPGLRSNPDHSSHEHDRVPPSPELC